MLRLERRETYEYQQEAGSSMKVTQVSMFYLPIKGGQEAYVANLNRVFHRNNVATEVVQPGRGCTNQDDVIMLPSIRGIGRLLPDAAWFLFNMELIVLRNHLRQSDVLISHYPFHYPVLRWHKSVIVVSHGLDWRMPPRTLADRYRVYSAKLCKENSAFVVANDTHFLRGLGYDVQPGTNYFQAIDRNVWFIPNCVDTTRFQPTGVSRENIVLVPRNIRRVRGIHLAIEAFSLFAQRNRNFTMQVVGGPLKGKYYMNCVDLVRKCNLEERVSFVGSVPWDALATYYNRSALTLIPTLELEGTSLSAIESMACKTPVVSTNVAGLNDLPTLKAEPIAESISNKLQEALTNWGAISAYQYDEVLTTFNLGNWERAWMSVMDGIAVSGEV